MTGGVVVNETIFKCEIINQEKLFEEMDDRRESHVKRNFFASDELIIKDLSKNIDPRIKLTLTEVFYFIFSRI